MQEFEFNLLGMQNFIINLREYVRKEITQDVRQYIDQKMESIKSDFNLLGMQNFIINLKEYVRKEITQDMIQYIDRKMESIKNEMLVVNKPPDENINIHEIKNQSGRQLKKQPKIRDKMIEQIKTKFNKIVINDLFIGCTLVGTYKKRSYEVTVNSEGNFVHNGKIYNSPSTAATRMINRGNYNGWIFFYVRFDPREIHQSLSYHRYQYFHNNLKKNDLIMYNQLLPYFQHQPSKSQKEI